MQNIRHTHITRETAEMASGNAISLRLKQLDNADGKQWFELHCSISVPDRNDNERFALFAWRRRHFPVERVISFDTKEQAQRALRDILTDARNTVRPFTESEVAA